MAFTIALELSLDEAKDLLASAGFALSRSSKTDIIVAYFLQNKIYDMFELNFKAVGRAISKAVESDAMVDFMDNHWADEIQAYKEGKNDGRC